jgi:hypothetical protein
MAYDNLISAPGLHPPPTPPVKGGEWKKEARNELSFSFTDIIKRKRQVKRKEPLTQPPTH